MLSTTAEYALRIMVVLAESNGAPITSERIAGFAEVPADYSVKVLQMLARAGLVRAQRGRGGGFHADCDLAVTTLLDVVDAIDPFRRIARCPVGEEDPPGRLCPLHRTIDEAILLVQDRLRRITLRALVDGDPGSALCRPAKVAVSHAGL